MKNNLHLLPVLQKPHKAPCLHLQCISSVISFLKEVGVWFFCCCWVPPLPFQQKDDSKPFCSYQHCGCLSRKPSDGHQWYLSWKVAYTSKKKIYIQIPSYTVPLFSIVFKQIYWSVERSIFCLTAFLNFSLSWVIYLKNYMVNGLELLLWL